MSRYKKYTTPSVRSSRATRIASAIPAFPAYGGVAIAGRNTIGIHDFERLFKGIIYSCTKKRSTAIAKLQFKVYHETNVQGGKEPVPLDNPFVKLFKDPNPTIPHQTRFETFSGIEESLCQTGEAYLWTPKNGLDFPVQMWALPSTSVKPMTSDEKVIGHFEWKTPGGGTKKLPPEEVLFFKDSAPSTSMWTNLTQGYSKLEAALDAVLVEANILEHFRDSLEGRMLPPYYLSSDNAVDPQDWEYWKVKLKEAFLNKRGQSRDPAMLPKGWKIGNIQVDQNSAPLVELRDSMVDIICVVYDVPKGLLNQDYGNQAPASLAKEINAAFQDTTIENQAIRYDETFSRWARNYDPTLVIEHEPLLWRNPKAVQDDERHRFASAQATINDLRRENGQDPSEEEGADWLFINGRPLRELISMGSAPRLIIEDGTKPKDVPVESAELTPEALEDPNEVVRSENVPEFQDSAFLDWYWLRSDAATEGLSVGLEIGIEQWFEELEKEILDSIQEETRVGVGVVTFQYDEEGLVKRLIELTGLDLSEHILRMVHQSFAEMGEDPTDIVSDFDKLQSDLLKRSTDKITESVPTVKAELQELLDSLKGLSAEDIASGVSKQFKNYSSARVSNIARTTATYTTGASQTEAWKILDVSYRWLSMRDGRVRPSHQAVDGTYPDSDGYFHVGNDLMKHPAAGGTSKESSRCRCMLFPTPTRSIQVRAFIQYLYQPWKAALAA